MSNEQAHFCDCYSGERTLALISQNLCEDYPELLDFCGKSDWNYLPELDIIHIGIGGASKWTGIAEVSNFLHGILLEPDRLDNLRVAWVDRSQPLIKQFKKLIYDGESIRQAASLSSSELFSMLRERRIETWFQPVVTKSGAIWGYECLMRGRRTDGALVSALELLKWAKQEHLIFMLDRVCREVHLENAGRLGFTNDIRFLINFLPSAIYEPEFCLRSSLAAARKCGLLPEQIIFEIVETEKVKNTDKLKKILDFYRASGFGVALDDIGSAYSGLNLLGTLKPDLIKIDRELVSQVGESSYHRDICASIIKLGKDNGQFVLAEGVETPEQQRAMELLETDLYQGYLFSKPFAAAEIHDFHARHYRTKFTGQLLMQNIVPENTFLV